VNIFTKLKKDVRFFAYFSQFYVFLAVLTFCANHGVFYEISREERIFFYVFSSTKTNAAKHRFILRLSVLAECRGRRTALHFIRILNPKEMKIFQKISIFRQIFGGWCFHQSSNLTSVESKWWHDVTWKSGCFPDSERGDFSKISGILELMKMGPF
jgi:hypothetical protein